MYSPDYQQFARMHPFHFVFDREMILRQVGPAIPKIISEVDVGAPFADFFQIQRPRIQPTFAAIAEAQRSAFLLHCLHTEVILKGQMVEDALHQLLFFIGSPVIHERTQLKNYGLTLSDFPMQDSTVDLVVFQQQRLINQKLEDLINERTHELEAERTKSEALLHAILPAVIVQRLKFGETLIADKFATATILFADLVNFTPMTIELAPGEMVELLNEIFSHFDSLTAKYGVEKIRTIGDNYMVASGVPRPRPDHAHALARMALEMSAYLQSRPPVRDKQVNFRIGINSGPLIGGVIGNRKFQYDLWGDAVNIASRMESSGTAGKIQITAETYALIKDEFVCEPRGKVMVKGKGELETWYLVDLKAICEGSTASLKSGH
jgi:class 3 adenylate cyclase